MGHSYIELQNVKRMTRFPYMVYGISLTNGIHAEVNDSICGDVLGICIRLGSDQPYADDVVNGVAYQTSFPNVFVKHPRARLRFGYSAAREVIEIKYSLTVMQRLLAALSFPTIPVFECTLGDKENAIIRELQHLMAHSFDYGVADRIDVIAFELLELLILNAEKQGDSGASASEKTIMKIASYFQLHFKEKILWKAFLQRYGMSRSTFLRHWKHFFHQSPDQYRLGLKMREACRLLREEPGLSIEEIAEQLYFCEANYFCSVFRKIYGTTPLQMRRKYQNGEAVTPPVE